MGNGDEYKILPQFTVPESSAYIVYSAITRSAAVISVGRRMGSKCGVFMILRRASDERQSVLRFRPARSSRSGSDLVYAIPYLALSLSPKSHFCANSIRDTSGRKSVSTSICVFQSAYHIAVSISLPPSDSDSRLLRSHSYASCYSIDELFILILKFFL